MLCTSLNDLRKENNILKLQIEELKESEEHTEIGRAKVSHTTNNQETDDLKVAALNVVPNKLYTCIRCEKDVNSEKGLKGHMIFKHTDSTLNRV